MRELKNSDGMSGFIRQQKRRHQRDVVCKKPQAPAQERQQIEKSALGRRPSCCLQDSPAAVLSLASAVAGDFVPPAQGAPGDILSNSSGSTCATSADSPDRPADIPDRRRSFVDDNRCGVGAGMRACCKPAVEDDKGQAERFADSNGNGGCSSRGSGREWNGFIPLEAPKRAVLAKKFQRVETTDFWPVFAGKATLLSTGSVTSAFDR